MINSSSKNKNLSPICKENKTQNQVETRQRVDAKADKPDRNRRTKLDLIFMQWTKSEQKLLFSLMHRHFSSWEKYAACLLNRTRTEIADFTLKSFTNLKNLKFKNIIKNQISPKNNEGSEAC